MSVANRYRLVRRISRTEMAEVHEAVDEVLGRTVAVKLLLPELASDESFVARFQREARAAASLNHPNIVSVYDFGEDAGEHFIVMEYIDGPTLAEIIRNDAPLPESRAAEIGSEIAGALAAAHAQGIVHRDIKPGNVLCGPGGAVKVVDFGIARALESHTDLTKAGTIVGSASYLSPEQARGDQVGPASDIYSLGAVLYAMTAAQPPFVADSPIAVAHQHVNMPPVPLRERNPEVSFGFASLVMNSLAKDPADRPPSAAAVREALLDSSDDATRSMPAATTLRAEATGATQVIPRRSSPWLSAVVAFLVALAIVLLIAAIATSVRNNNNTSPTTAPSTTSTTARRAIITVPRILTTQPPETTEAPTTTAEPPDTIFPPVGTEP